MSYERASQYVVHLTSKLRSQPKDGLASDMFTFDHLALSKIFVIVVVTLLIADTLRRTVVAALTSPLNRIPGPWYGPWTQMHLRWHFARGTIWKYVEDKHKQYGDTIRLGPRHIWVSDAKSMKDILMTTDLPKITMYAEISRDRFSPGLFGEIRPDPHKKLKKFLGPAFTVSSVDKIDTFFMNCTRSLIRNYEEQASQYADGCFDTDFMRDLHCLALDIMGSSSFGKGFGQIDNIFRPWQIITAKDKEWSKIPDAIFNGVASRYRIVFFKRFLRRMGLDLQFSWPKYMTKAISELIDERKVSTKQSERIDILQHLLDDGIRPDNNQKMSNQDMIDQMSELLLAGAETTSGTIACLFLEVARNPKVAEKLYKSLEVQGPDDELYDSKTVREDKRFEYLEACIKENLRLHPIASEMGRRNLSAGYSLDGYELPKYTIVSASYRRLHQNEAYWPQADRFWPERWLEGSAREGAPEPNQSAYYPFSNGKHICIGKNFAYAEMRTVAANLFSRFEVVDLQNKNIDFRQYITMQFSDGAWEVSIKPRWDFKKPTNAVKQST